MKKEIGFLLFSLLLVAAMALSSCGTPTTSNPTAVTITGQTKTTTAATTKTTTNAAAATTSATTSAATTAGAEMMKDSIGQMIEKPQYGGTYTTAYLTDIIGFDNAYTYNYNLSTVNQTNEPLIAGDWAKGPAGTNQTSFQMAGVVFLQFSTGIVAESWDIPDTETMIFHIRHGIHFQNKPPVNGRELTANDVAWSIKRDFETPGAYCQLNYRGADAPLSITATDDWTVTVKCNTGKQGPLFIVISGFINIFPKDGGGADGTFKDWKNSNGTGPFLLTDYVPSSSSTIIKNPDYWRDDPLTGMRLPYVDKSINLVIPDMSTIIAGLQTGKIDHYTGVPWDQAESLKTGAPTLRWADYVPAGTYSIHMQMGKGLPWDDIKVRWALSKAINREKILNDFYGGNASIFAFPIPPIPELSEMFTPLAELPANVQNLFKYDVAAAKQLMKDAGAEAGFKAEITVSGASQTQQDMLALVANMWKDINVTLTIKPMDYAVFVAQINAKSFPNMAYTGDGTSAPYKFNNWRPNNPQNSGNVVAPQVVAAYDELNKFYPFDAHAANLIVKSQTAYILENCWEITPPYPYTFWFAQPWLKNYNGEISCGYYQTFGVVAYRWIDQKMKTEMKK